MQVLFNFLTCLIFSVVVFSGSSDAQKLKSSWIGSSKNISYEVGTQPVTWYKAYVLCRQIGMELASISSDAEEIAVENYLRPFAGNKTGPYEGFWIAGTRFGTCSSDFVWLTTGKPVIYRKFAAGQPDNAGGNEPCLELFLNTPNAFAWNDIDCNVTMGFICQTSMCS